MERLWVWFPVQAAPFPPPIPHPTTTQRFSSGCPVSSHLKDTMLQTKIWNQSHSCLGHNPWPWWQLSGIKNRLKKKIYAFARNQEQTQKENLCVRMESRTDSERKSKHSRGIKNRLRIWERKSMHSHGIKNRFRKSMHSHWIKNRIRKKIHAFACTHLSSGTAGWQFIALTFKIGLTTRSLNLRETVMSSDSSSSEKTERERKKRVTSDKNDNA